MLKFNNKLHKIKIYYNNNYYKFTIFVIFI